jgi:release factor glutamine methyltransferase
MHAEEAAVTDPAATAGSRGEALSAAVDALSAAGVDSPRLDAELLLAAAAGTDRAALVADPAAPVTAAAGRAFGEMVRRRLRREPVAYILSRKGFRGIEVAVDARVLIPRPETELLVEVAVELEPRTVLDVGTGSGAVALAVAAEVPEVRVTATDSSPGALEVARGNAERLGLAGRVDFVEGTLPEGGRFDLMLANLPYVAEAEWPQLEPEIRDWEPREAVLAGPDGTAAIGELLAAVGGSSRGQERIAGVIALEVGAGQAGTVATLLAEAGYPRTETREDLAGIERVVVGRR